MNSAVVERAANPFASGVQVVAAPSGAGAAAMVQREAQNIQVQMMMARNFPRDVVRATDKIINAFTRPELCEEGLYAFSKGGSNVSGLSIRAAEVLAQNWGNILTGVQELSRANGQSEIRAYAQDLETGFVDEKQFFVRHWRDTRQGGKPVTEEREIYELGANMGARRKRACILAVIPKDVQDAAERQIEITLKSKADVTPESIKALTEAFARFGVTKEMIEKRIQRHIEAMLPAQLVQMRRIFASLKDGMSNADEWFEVPPPATQADQSAGGSQTDAVKERLRGGTSKAEEKKPAGGSAGEDLGGYVPQYDETTAVAEIKKATDQPRLDAIAAAVRADFEKSNRQVPVGVDAAIHDRAEAIKALKK